MKGKAQVTAQRVTMSEDECSVSRNMVFEATIEKDGGVVQIIIPETDLAKLLTGKVVNGEAKSYEIAEAF